MVQWQCLQGQGLHAVCVVVVAAAVAGVVESVLRRHRLPGVPW